MESSFLYSIIKKIYFSDFQKLCKRFNIVLDKKDNVLKQYNTIVREVIKTLCYSERKKKDVVYIGARVLARAMYEKLDKKNYDSTIQSCGGLYKYGLGLVLSKVKKIKVHKGQTEEELLKTLGKCK